MENMEMNNEVQNFDLSSLLTVALPIRGHAEIEKTVESLFDRVCNAVNDTMH
jgi:hypothetical protein